MPHQPASASGICALSQRRGFVVTIHREPEMIRDVVNPFQVLVLAFLIGAVSGLRALTAPAAVAWAANRHWLGLQTSLLSWMGSTSAVAIFTVLALGELVIDKLPSTPNRTAVPGLIARGVFGGLSGAAVAAAGGQSIGVGAALGASGGIAGAFTGYNVRRRLVHALKIPDLAVALLEDAVAIAAGLLIASRF
jgi:uncharacterized membrane protein